MNDMQFTCDVFVRNHSFLSRFLLFGVFRNISGEAIAFRNQIPAHKQKLIPCGISFEELVTITTDPSIHEGTRLFY